MATNEILPFATDDIGTNLLTQAEYVVDEQREIGHQPGIARSKLANKAMRQASLLAAGLAEFIADYQANNVTDSLTPQQIADYLLAAITANIPSVPDASTTAKGIIEIATAAEAQSFVSSLLAITPSTLNQALKGSNQSLATTGYQKLPGGLILQWVEGAVESIGVNTARTTTLTLPITFPTSNLITFPGSRFESVARFFVVEQARSVSNVTVISTNVSTFAGGTHRPRVLAIGY